MRRSNQEVSHNQHPKVAEDLLSEPAQEASQRTPRTKTIPLQVGTGPDLLTKHSWGGYRATGATQEEQ